MTRKITEHEQVILELLRCEAGELRKHTRTVFEWRGVFLEVLTPEQRERSGVPGSWYTTHYYLGKEWKIREMGDKATKVKRIKRGGEKL